MSGETYHFWKPGTIAPGSTIEKRLDLGTYGGGGGGEEQTDLLPACVPIRGSMEQARKSLPVYRHRKEFLYSIEHNRVVIVVGETGSGKTTQLPQYLWEEGWTGPKMVAVTQPRRVAAISIATRVSEETGNELGSMVGYAVRFDERLSPQTRIKYLTDGMLFREALFDPLLSHYSVVMIDEAHERSLHTDLLLGLLKKIARRREDLKIVISSATMDARAFQDYFTMDKVKPVILSVEGRTFPVSLFYLQEMPTDVMEEAVLTVQKIYDHRREGDTLVFLPGRDEIEKCRSLLTDHFEHAHREDVKVLPLYATLPLDQQMKVFDEKRGRGEKRVILATNIAETSLTIGGIVYVVDCGLVKQRVYDPVAGMEALLTTHISQAAAQQRAGRAGRVCSGEAYRLYTEEHYHQLVPQSIPEIQKCNLTPVLLQLKALGIDNVANFDFPSPPSPDSMARALEHLLALGAIDEFGKLTEGLGTTMAELPIDPPLARVLIASNEFHCGAEALIVVAMLNAQPVFVNVPLGAQKALEEAKRRLGVAEGDLVSMVNIYRSFHANSRSPRWCARHFINHKSMLKASHIARLLGKYMERYGLKPNESSTQAEHLQKTLVRGLFANAAESQPDGSYRSIRDGTTLYIHPASVLFRRVPRWVVYWEMVETGKRYMRDVTVVEPDWLADAAPSYYEFSRKRPAAIF